MKATRIAALLNQPPNRFFDIDTTLIIISGDIFDHLAPETMCPTWLNDEMARTYTLICGSQTVVDTIHEVQDTDTERRLSDDFHTPRIGNVLRTPMFSWPTKARPAGYPTAFNLL